MAPNKLQREFTVEKPDQVWVTDITYLRTWQGWLYLAVVLDLFSRRVVGWSMKPSLAKELVLDALIMAVWRRKPATRVMVHSDQGSQYGSDAWQRFLLAHNLEPSMSRQWQLLGQRSGRVFLQQLEEGADQETDLQNP